MPEQNSSKKDILKAPETIPTCVLWCDYITLDVKVKLGYAKYFNCVQEMNILGITSNDGIYNVISGFHYIPKEEINRDRFDYVIILEDDDKLDSIRAMVLSYGFSDEAIIPFKVMTLDGFELKKYCRIKKNTPSIFSVNCWGGITYHSLGLRFNSPTINMFFDERAFIRFMQEPGGYLNKPLELDSTGYNPESGINFPIAKCGDILLYFNHYDSFECASECWYKRTQRINWDNIFVMMWTENKDIASEFTKLPYDKKVCFVPFPTEESSLLYVDYLTKLPELKLWQVNLALARGQFLFYNVFDLLNDGKITKTTILHDI